MSAHADHPEEEEGYGAALAEAPARPEMKEPPLFKVVLLNDDFTPMDFVVEVLCRLFAMTEDQSVQVMLAIHQQGKGVCGTFTRDVAESKVAQVTHAAQAHEHPLKAIMEEV